MKEKNIITDATMTILECREKIRVLVEKYGEESEGGKDIYLKEDVPILPNIFGYPRPLKVQRLRTYCDNVFLADRAMDYVIGILEDEQNPGHELLIYQNERFRLLNGPGASEVGACEEVDPYDIEIIYNVALESVGEKH